MEAGDETYAAMELANALAREHTVFLCNAQPRLLDEAMRNRLSPRLILVRGDAGADSLVTRGRTNRRRAKARGSLRRASRARRVDPISFTSMSCIRIRLRPIAWCLRSRTRIAGPLVNSCRERD